MIGEENIEVINNLFDIETVRQKKFRESKKYPI